MMAHATLQQDLAATVGEAVRAEAEKCAGRPEQTTLRGFWYHRLYLLSNRGFVFALIGAHGCMWAAWYLRLMRRLASIFAHCDLAGPGDARARMAEFDAFVDACLKINRAVFVDTHVTLHLLDRLGHKALDQFDMPPALKLHMQNVMIAKANGAQLDRVERRACYEAYFRWQQAQLVTEPMNQAARRFRWPLMKSLCLRPWVWLSYFRLGRSMNFRNFADAEERVAKGLAAYDRAEGFGWHRVEANLRSHSLFPTSAAVFMPE